MNERSCGCALKCCDKLSTEKRKAIFKGFWELGNFDVQNAYLTGCIQVKPVQRHYSPGASRRGNTRLFYVRDGEYSVRVCKSAFLLIHGVSNGRVSRALQGVVKTGGLPMQDQRGHHEPPNKTTEEDMAFICNHIESFPSYTSHYSRSDNPNRKYLSPDLSLAKMYSLYKVICTKEGKKQVSDWVYRKIFNERYNLCFGRCVNSSIIHAVYVVCILHNT